MSKDKNKKAAPQVAVKVSKPAKLGTPPKKPEDYRIARGTGRAKRRADWSHYEVIGGTVARQSSWHERCETNFVIFAKDEKHALARYKAKLGLELSETEQMQLLQ